MNGAQPLSTGRSATADKRHCGRCDTRGYQDDRFCPCCGHAMGRDCKVCGAFTPHPDANYCTGCGTPFPATTDNIDKDHIQP